MNQLLMSMNAGELSPLLTNRLDLEKRASGCKEIVNCIVLDEGGISRRPGGRVAAGLASYQAHRLVAFESSMRDCFVLDFRNNAIDVYDLAGVLLKSMPVSWNDGDLMMFQFCQVNDLLWFTHPTIGVVRIEWHGGSDFRVVRVDTLLEKGPWETMTDQTTQITLQLLGAPYYVNLNGAVPLSVSYVGKKLRVRVRIPAQAHVFNSSYPITNWTRPFLVKGKWTLRTTGSWTADYRLDRAENTVAPEYGTFRQFSSTNGSQNYNFDGTEDDAVYFRLFKRDGGDNNAEVTLSVDPFYLDIVVKITSVTLPNIAYVDVLNYPVVDPALLELATIHWTKNWSLEAFSTFNGYPSAITFHQGRLWLGGTKSKPQTVWASKVDDYTNFETGSDADDALALTILSQTRDKIAWMAAGEGVLVGTESSEWSIRGEQGKAITPTGFEIKRQSGEGSAALQPLIAPQSLLYVKQGGTKLMELAYSFQDDGWVSQDLTVLAEHVLKARVKMAALQRLPYCIVWCVLEDGSFAGITYNRAQQVFSWHRHMFGDGWTVESCCVTHDPKEGTTSGFDALWLAVEADGEKKLVKVTFDPERGQWTDDGHVFEARMVLLPVDVLAQDGSTVGMPKRIAQVQMKLEAGTELIAGVQGGRMDPVRFNDQEQGWVHADAESATMKEPCFQVVHKQDEPFVLTTMVIKWEAGQ